jgi:hypothetical protein
MPTYRADLETEVDSLEYNFNTGVGRLYMPHRCCTDMDGCIRLFTAIDPNVKIIRTLSGLEWDTVYERHGDSWKARASGRVTV